MLPPPRELGGVLVAATTHDAAFWNGELVPGDVIHALNGKSISGISSLRSELETLDPGDAVVLRIQRQDRLMFVAFVLKRKPD